MSLLHCSVPEPKDGPRRYLIFGANGFIGTELVKLLKEAQQTVIVGSRITNELDAESMIRAIRPDRVVCSVGLTHVTDHGTIDELEDPEMFSRMLLANFYVPIWLAHICTKYEIPMLYMGTGCIYEYKGLTHSIDGLPFTEQDAPNFFGSSYSRVKAQTDFAIAKYPYVINARIRMPIADYESPRDLLCKLHRYEKIYDVPNSMTVLSNVLPILVGLLHAFDLTKGGTYNAVNTGPMRLLDALRLYEQNMWPNKVFHHTSVASEDQLQLKSRRSNNALDSEKLQTAYLTLDETTRKQFHIQPLMPVGEAVLSAIRKRVPKRVLITGGYGFIGSHFVETLMKDPTVECIVNVDMLDTCSSLFNVADVNLEKDYIFFQWDLASNGIEDKLANVMSLHQITHVVHFAAKTHVDASFDGTMALEYTRTNVLGTHKLLEATRRHLVTCPQFQCFLHMSTDEVYGETIDFEAHESSLLNPTNPYAATKAAAEFLVRAYGLSFGLPWKMVRCNNVYGPRQFPEKVIPKFITQALDGEPLTLHGTGETKRMFIHVSDVCQAVKVVMTEGRLGEIYNIASNAELSISQLAQTISEFMESKGKHVVVQNVADRPFNDARYAINDAKLRCLGWEPRVPFEEGLLRLMESMTYEAEVDEAQKN